MYTANSGSQPSFLYSRTLPDRSEEETKELLWPPPGGGGGMSGTSPGKSPGCARAKTMKEYEAELVELRRDNFDLRMRIYLMEEQEEAATASTSAIINSDSRIPPSFSHLKELYMQNTQLKEEITGLKKELCEKEELVLQAATAVETMEKNQMERFTQMRVEADAESQKLQKTISQLTQEVLEMKENQLVNVGGDQRSMMFDDSNAMYAMAFGLPIPGKNIDPAKQAAQEKISTLELKLVNLETEMKEESERRLSCDEKLDRVRVELKRCDEGRRLLKDELKHRETELVRAHKLIEDKCQTISELEEKLRPTSANSAVDLITNKKRTPGVGCDVFKRIADSSSLSEFENQLVQLRDQLKAQKVENLRIQGENMKAMKTIQGLVKQNKAVTRDLEHYKTMQRECGDGGQTSGPSTTSKDKISEEILGDSLCLNKDNRITELVAEITILKEKLSTVSFGCADQTSDINALQMELEIKNTEIENLNEELKKRTFNLQELVNKELWDKNREIEKLNLTCERKQCEMNNLKKELTAKSLELSRQLEGVKNISSESIGSCEFKENTNPNLPSVSIDEKLKNELRISVEENNKVREEIENVNKKLMDQILLSNALKEDCKKWKFAFEESDKGRKELVNACTLLTTRLEELSTFLESLLPSLGSKKRRMLQQAIDRSREMSRSFSFMDQSNLSVPLLPDVSQVDFCSGDEILNLETKDVSSENDEVVRLRNQVESLVEKLRRKEASPDKSLKGKKAIWSLDEERLEDITEGSLLASLSDVSDCTATVTTPCKRASLAIIARPIGSVETEQQTLVSQQSICLSESEGWSEPDRNVSKERIGINDLSPTQKTSLNSSEESVKSNKKSPSGKKLRNEGLLELKKLSAKLDSLEQMNEALHAELQVIHRSNAARLEENNLIISKPNSPKSLREIVNNRRRSLEKMMNLENQNPFDSDIKSAERDILSERIKEMSVQLEKSCRRCLELEERCLTLEDERKQLEDKLNETEVRLKSVEVELETTVASLKEKDNHLLEKQCQLLESNNNNILLTAKLDTVTENINIKQDLVEKYEREMSEKNEKYEEMSREMEDLKKGSEEFETELKQKLLSCQRQVEEQVNLRLDVERRLIESYENQTELRSRLDQEILRSKDLENHFKHEERIWRRRLAECESMRAEREVELRRKLDTAVLTTSEAVLERTRLANDKLKLQHDLRTKESSHFSVMKELERRVVELETLNSELEAAARCRWEVRQEPLGCGGSGTTGLRSPTSGLRSPTNGLRSPTGGFTGLRSPTLTTAGGALSPPLSPSSPRSPRPPRRHLSNPSSDYVSDQEHPYQVNGNFWSSSGSSGRCNNNCSPDLGIESDHHSLATCGKVPSLDPLPTPVSNGDVTKLEVENDNLRKQLLKTRNALTDTLSQLTSANQKKKQVERAICKQIHKTHHVLQKARVNFESNDNQQTSQ